MLVRWCKPAVVSVKKKIAPIYILGDSQGLYYVQYNLELNIN